MEHDSLFYNGFYTSQVVFLAGFLNQKSTVMSTLVLRSKVFVRKKNQKNASGIVNREVVEIGTISNCGRPKKVG